MLTPLAGCSDLDTTYQGQYVSQDVKSELKEQDPALLRASVTGIPALFSGFEQVVSADIDFGFPAMFLMLDSRGQDMVSTDIGYNWFTWMMELSDCAPNSYTSRLPWNYCYRQAFACNALLRDADKESKDPMIQFYMAQAYGIRAYDYFTAAQIYQFTYKGNESKPCIMLITEDNQEEAETNGTKRSTVEETYAQILSDINECVRLLEECEVKPSDVIDTGSGSKRFLSLAAAYGLRARINLVMENWAEAADDADKAIRSFIGSPLSLTQAGKPGFADMEEQNWMWGIYIATTDRVATSQIINFPSHMGSLNYGYASVGAWRMVNKALYNAIPETDVRKNWFLNAEHTSPGLSEAQAAYTTGKAIPQYAQVKFAPYGGVVGTTQNASDVPLMRIEEMYYILAEATAMNGGDGASILKNFVTTYRDPKYRFAGSGEQVQKECWQQRRVEFFGEGISFFDLKRLKKGIDRRGGGFQSEYVYVVEPTDNIFVLPLPEGEINGNPAITTADNNSSAPMPLPITEE